MRPSWKGPLLAVGVFAAAYFAASPPFWHETVERVVRLYRQVLKIGFSIEVDTLFEVERSWMEVFSAPLDVAITTPLPVLALAVLGVLRGRSFGGLKRFLCVGAVFPVLRTQLPGARDFDGVRHFLEFYPCLCALAGLGLLVLLEETRERWRSRALQLAVPAACLAPGLVGVISTYPFGIAYFNALVGGLAGAQAAGVPEATDYWGGSYWQGQAWLSEHADPESSLVVPIHDPVVRSTAPLRLRSDIRVQPRTAAKCPGTLWVMFVTHRGFYGRLTKYLEARAEPVHRIRVQGGTILAIYRLAGEAEKLEAFERIRQDRELVRMIQALSLWIREDPDRRKLFTGVVASIVAGEHERAAQELRDVLGTVTDEQARMLVEWIVELRT
jgi:hypothetical protein